LRSTSAEKRGGKVARARAKLIVLLEQENFSPLRGSRSGMRRSIRADEAKVLWGVFVISSSRLAAARSLCWPPRRPCARNCSALSNCCAVRSTMRPCFWNRPPMSVPPRVMHGRLTGLGQPQHRCRIRKYRRQFAQQQPQHAANHLFVTQRTAHWRGGGRCARGHRAGSTGPDRLCRATGTCLCYGRGDAVAPATGAG
jgi:hypothetical protein